MDEAALARNYDDALIERASEAPPYDVAGIHQSRPPSNDITRAETLPLRAASQRASKFSGLDGKA